MNGAATIEVEGRKIALTEVSRIIYPETHTTKWDVLGYYARLSHFILPHLQGKPIPLRRHLDTAEQPPIIEAACPVERPEWLRTCTLEEPNGGSREYCVLDDLSSLLWMVNLGMLEIAPLAVTCENAEHPSTAIFRLEPCTPATLYDCIEAVRYLRDILEAVDLSSVVKTDGDGGLQVYVPLDGSATAAEVRTFAHAVSILLHREHPALITSTLRRDLHAGWVLLDWTCNARRSASIAPYSLRGSTHPLVSTPLAWEEIDIVRTRNDIRGLQFDIDDVVKRVDALGDLFAMTLRKQQRLPSLG